MSGFKSKKFERQKVKSRLDIGRISQATSLIIKDRRVLLRRFFLVFAVLAVLAYVGWQGFELLAPPQLVVDSPVDNLVTDENLITISGWVETDATLTINQGKVVPNTKGEFSQVVYLQTGLNLFTFAAKKRYSKVKTIIRRVITSQITNGQATSSEVLNIN